MQEWAESVFGADGGKRKNPVYEFGGPRRSEVGS